MTSKILDPNPLHSSFFGLLLLSAFPFNQGLPQCIIFLQTVLFSTSVSFAPTSPISSFITSKNLFFCLPLFLFPGNSISITLLFTYSWSLLMTCLYHLSLPSLIFIPNCSTLTVPLMYSFLILSFLVTPIARAGEPEPEPEPELEPEPSSDIVWSRSRSHQNFCWLQLLTIYFLYLKIT